MLQDGSLAESLIGSGSDPLPARKTVWRRFRVRDMVRSRAGTLVQRLMEQGACTASQAYDGRPAAGLKAVTEIARKRLRSGGARSRTLIWRMTGQDRRAKPGFDMTTESIFRH